MSPEDCNLAGSASWSIFCSKWEILHCKLSYSVFSPFPGRSPASALSFSAEKIGARSSLLSLSPTCPRRRLRPSPWHRPHRHCHHRHAKRGRALPPVSVGCHRCRPQARPPPRRPSAAGPLLRLERPGADASAREGEHPPRAKRTAFRVGRTAPWLTNANKPGATPSSHPPAARSVGEGPAPALLPPHRLSASTSLQTQLSQEDDGDEASSAAGMFYWWTNTGKAAARAASPYTAPSSSTPRFFCACKFFAETWYSGHMSS